MIEFLCTLAGMIAGAAIVVSIMSVREQSVHEDFINQMDNINSAKIRGITTQLKSLSERVLDNVSNHSSKLKTVGEELANPDGADAEKILGAVDSIIAANQQMQDELQTAQRQLAEQQEIIEQTTMQAKSDALTGLANRRALDEYLFDLLNSKSNGSSVGLLLMDIDHFKRFNDTYGHLTGDAVLTCFARLISQCAGPKSFCARYGGEEFVVVLHGDNEKELVNKAAYIRQFASEQTISHEDLELTITASAGLCFAQPGDNLSIAYERSDQGLYKSKEAGRNRGMWLDKDNWMPLPTLKTTDACEVIHEAPEPKQVGQPPEVSASTAEPVATEVNGLPNGPSEDTDQEAFVFLDLASFVDRVRDHLNQLQQMDLPAATVMVEAVVTGTEQQCRNSWQESLSIIQTKIRGIDILCHFRPNTICIFLPGCSAEASYERASEIKQQLLRSLANWKTEVAPEKFAVAVSHVLEKEDVASMLNRLEQTLDEAHHSDTREIAIHDGASTQFLQL
jgi:diguanylate cyclase